MPASLGLGLDAAPGVGSRALDALAWVVARLPFASLRALGALLGVVAGSLLAIRRRHVDEALARAGLDSRAAPRMYGSLGTGVFELLWMAGRGPGALADVASIDEASRRLFDDARSRGRGIVLAATHTGNWDLAACVVGRALPLLVVTKRLRVGSLDAFWQRTRAKFGVRLTTADAALSRARDALASGGAVAMMIDQVPQRRRHGFVATFLGAEAWLDKAPAVLAARTGAPMIVAASSRGAGGRHVLYALLVLEPPLDAGTAWIEAATRQAAAALEVFVRAHPESWLWMHRRWKAPLLEVRERRSSVGASA